jgi:lysophospholipase L1-like esterase
VHALKSSRSLQNLLLVGDSRIEALQCDDILPKWNVLNLGVSGLTAKQLKASLEQWLVRSRQFHRAVVWIGINDILHHRREPEQVANEIGQIAGLLMDRTSRVAVIGQIPMFNDTSSDAVLWTNKDLNGLQQALDARLEILNRTGKIDRLTLFSMDTETIPQDAYSDAIHLSATGNRLACGLLESWLSTP